MPDLADLRWIKIKRCLRRVPSAALKRFIEPVFNSGQILTFAASVIGLWLILRFATPVERDLLANQWAISIEAFAIALAGWALISFFTAPFTVWREERRKGSWHGKRFVYRKPLLVTTIRCQATGAVERYRIRFSDAEANAFVAYHVELTPDISRHANFGVGNALLLGVGRAQGRGGCRLDGREAAFYIEAPENVVSTTARVFCESFVIGNPDDKDGSRGDIGPEIRQTAEGYAVGGVVQAGPAEKC